MSKQKFPRAEAHLVAVEMLNHLAAFCEQVEVAGSYRRGKAEVGDLEFVFVPRSELVPVDLFGNTQPVDLAAKRIDELVTAGVIARRTNHNGVVSWGNRNKYAVHVATGMLLDFFATTESAWFNYLVCRTGSDKTNIAICRAAIARGWSWAPYAAGFMTPGGMRAVSSEREVFELVGLPYREPGER
jgi:DNA polymerase/3'-5' exonuclease PolX